MLSSSGESLVRILSRLIHERALSIKRNLVGDDL
jgi:hypothetical protein